MVEEVASAINWEFWTQMITAACAVGGLSLSIYNFFERRSDLHPTIKLILDEWIDTSNYNKQKCLRCIIKNTGRIPLKYENLGVYTSLGGKNVELYRYSRVSLSTEKYSTTTGMQDVIAPNDVRMAAIRPQKVVRGLENQKIETRDITLFFELKSSLGESYKSNKVRFDFSGIDANDPNANKI